LPRPVQRASVQKKKPRASASVLTERKRAEAALRESEERYRQLVDSLSVPVAVHVDGKMVFANPEAVRTLHAPSLDALLGRQILDFVHPDYRAMVVQRVADAYAHKTDAPLANERFIRLDGEPFDVEVLVRAVTFDGQPAGQVVFWDVTERKRAEDALRESEERYRNLLEGLPDGVIVGLGNQVVFANKAARELLAVDKSEQLIGSSPAELVHPHDRVAAVARARRVIESGAPTAIAVERFLRADGATIIVETVALPIRHGEQPAVQLVFRDITDRRRAESERDRLFKLSTDMLCIAGLDGYFKQLNPAWSATLGWEQDELKAQPWIELVHPEDVEATRAAGERLLRGEHVTLFVNRYRRKDGGYRSLSWSSVPIPEEGLIFAVVRDVTERLRMEEQLQQSEKLTALGQLAGGVAHDFNNQLAGILGYAELLRERLPEDDTLRRYCDRIVTGAQRSAHLTRQLLAFARKGKYQVATVSLHGVIDEVLAILMHSIDKRIVVRRALAPTPIEVVGDPSQIQSALLNLAINARDAMPDGGELSFATSIATLDQAACQAGDIDLAPGRYACVRISDTGIGMDGDTLRRAYEPFFTTKELGRGTGLGLSAAYGIVHNHAGALRLSSAPGRGTTAEVLLPLAAVSPATTAGANVDEQVPHLRILLVDDEDLARTCAAEMLGGLGHTVTDCADGSEAVAVFSAAPADFDLVVMDMIMPVMSGAEAITRMRSLRPALPVVLCSGYSVDVEAQRVLGQDNLALLQKPFTSSDLAEAVSRAMTAEG
jgi:PAS domain S-box-containing protein